VSPKEPAPSLRSGQALSGAKGVEQPFSVPHVPLIVGNSVRVQQLPEFFLKADHAVVAFLLRDVL